MKVLVLNPGSATLKATVVAWPDRRPVFDRTSAWDVDRGTEDAINAEVARLVTAVGPGIDAVGYRVVHGGTRFTSATIVDDGVVAAIESLADLAPLHNTVAARTIRAARGLVPDVVHVASFDTGFHATLPEAAVRYPVPESWMAAGVRRYGFHGLSVAWSTRRAAQLLERPVDALRLVVAHLGGGCSVTAVDGGRSVDTSMGMTPLEGLMMATRAGSLDPGIVFRMLRAGRSADEVEGDLERRSGLVGIAGSGDMRALQDRATSDDDEAKLAIAMFVRRAAAGIAAATTALPRLDGVVFTGGIGEHADAVTERVLERLHLVAGTRRDAVVGGDRLARFATGPAVMWIAAREDLEIARQVVELVGAAP